MSFPLARILSVIILTALITFMAASRTMAQPGRWMQQDSVFFRENLIGFSGLAASDSLHCLAIGDNGDGAAVIRRTTNGGSTWDMIYVDGNRATHFLDIAHPTRSLAIIVGYDGAIRRSTDGGDTWQSISSDATTPDGLAIFQKISMVDSLHGIIGSSYRIILETNDGGATWSRIPPPDTSIIIMGIACLKPNTYILTTEPIHSNSNIVYRTENSGKSWQATPVLIGDSVSRDSIILQGMRFTDPLHGCIVGNSGTASFGKPPALNAIVKTTDGGVTWTTVLFQPPISGDYGLYLVDFADRDHGIAATGGGRVYYTVDGGDHWHPGMDLDSAFNVFSIRALCYPTAGKAWVANGFGKVFHYSDELPGSVPAANTSASLSIYPNPSNGNIQVHYYVVRRSHIRLTINNSAGQELGIFNDGDRSSGNLDYQLDLSHFPAGVYFLRLTTDNLITTKAVVLTK